MLLRHDEGGGAGVGSRLPLGHQIPHQLVVAPPEGGERRGTVHLRLHGLRDERTKPKRKNSYKKRIKVNKYVLLQIYK